MEIKKRLFLILVALLLVLIKLPIYSQEAEDGTESEVIEEIAAEEYWQYLEWEEKYPQYVSKYEVVVEKINVKDGRWDEVKRIPSENNTTKVQIRPLLPPGNYRYKIVTFNLLGIAESESDWFNFKIYKAAKPDITNIISSLNFTETIYLEDINDGIFIVSGKNLFMPADDENTDLFTKYSLEKQDAKNKKTLIPQMLEHNPNNKKIKVKFDINSFQIGVYNFIAEDASGLKSNISKKNEIIVKFKKAQDFNVSLGYAIPAIVFDDTFMKYLDSVFFPMSFTARAVYIPFKNQKGYLGAGISGTYTKMNTADKFDKYYIDGNLITSHLLFVCQKPLYLGLGLKRRHTFTFEVHGGIGAVFFNNYAFHFDFGIDTKPLNSIDFSIDLGGAVQYYFAKRIYAEFGLDFMGAIVPKMPFGTVVPSISVGWQF